ncbi:large conductance mechanosensitive channel protein MscL [Altererythrobacter sp. MF3-039]|uniref:large conductance mechanosensitive channel protein MscL n=1 Tax=Altererythrobacter sp. MF3-039 TaxID=3252901 RepID=UPI00390C8810
MSIATEFKKFIARGNVIDLAVGVVIGAAFGKITTSLAEGVIMPFVGWLFGDIDFSNKFILLGRVPEGYSGSPTNYAELKEAGAQMIGYGDLLTQVLNFLLIAFAVFMLVRGVNRAMDEIQDLAGQTEDSSKSNDVPTDPQLDVLKKILAEMRNSRPVAAPA